ncbi:hypothetical protein ACFSKW_27030 [Nonomuraea mangrovi]|uniref:VUT family protein n=1 Tax=Nonomuraea mangrovi TaxID=2316207 RepID=A0ABW4T1L5_9ACTN
MLNVPDRLDDQGAQPQRADAVLHHPTAGLEDSSSRQRARSRRQITGHTDHGSILAGIALPVLFACTMVAANLLSTSLTVPVGFGLTAPGGVYLAGLLFALRDVIHERSGPLTVLYALFAGLVLSGLLGSGRVAAASVAAVTLAELIDTAVYVCTRSHGVITAVVASNTTALLADTVVFLHIAFGSLAMAPGQIVGKSWMTVLAVLIVVAVRRRWSR